MSYPSRHGSIQIIRDRDDIYNHRKRRQRPVYVASSKSPSELIFFREGFQFIDLHKGTHLKDAYMNLIGSEVGNIGWAGLSDFFLRRQSKGYIAAINRICELVEEIFNEISGEIPQTGMDQIELLANYAEKVYSFRDSVLREHGYYDEWEWEDDVDGGPDEGHKYACDTWECAGSRLRNLKKSLEKAIPPPVLPVEFKVMPTPKPPVSLETVVEISITKPVSQVEAVVVTSSKIKSGTCLRAITIISFLIFFITILGTALYFVVWN